MLLFRLPEGDFPPVRILYRIRLPDIHEPLASFHLFRMDAGNEAAKGHGLMNGFVGQRLSAGAVHHGGAHIIGSDDRIVGRGGGMHHERFIEAAVADGVAPLAHMNHGCLGKRRQQLVCGLGSEHRGLVRAVFGRVPVHGETSFIHGVETGISIPCLVKVQAIHALPQQFFHSFHIIAQAVVG